MPEETVRAAPAAFPKGNGYLRPRDELGMLDADEAFAELFSTRGQPAEAPRCPVLVRVMQFAEGLSDRQAAEAVRARMSGNYTLGLELTDAGFDASRLSELRGRLVTGGVEAALFETPHRRGLVQGGKFHSSVSAYTGFSSIANPIFSMSAHTGFSGITVARNHVSIILLNRAGVLNFIALPEAG